MFTLKLYRHKGPEDRRVMHKVIAAYRVVVMDIGEKNHSLELQAFLNERGDYETYYVGVPDVGMEAYGRDDLHLGIGPNSWWGWGLLENWEGNTSEHYRPASYG